MGLLISRFRTPADSPSKKLDAITKEVSEIENYKRQNLARQKSAVASLIIYSILIYLVGAILYFVYYFPVLNLWNKILHSVPLLLFPALIYGVKKFLHWYFVKRITENDLKLADLREEKTKIIEDVMENETYKNATEILKKYAPSRLHKLDESEDSTICSPDGKGVRSPIPGSELRQRSNVSTMNESKLASATPTPMLNRTVPGRTPGTFINTPASKTTMQQRSMYGGPPGPPLPRQVLPRDPSMMDKVFEFLVADGPQNRYALICRCCLSHNGMALAEEFEYLGFRCCYCFSMNEARKKKPNAPRLNLDTTIGSSSDEASAVLETDGDEEEDDSDTEELSPNTQLLYEPPADLPASVLPAANCVASETTDNSGDK